MRTVGVEEEYLLVDPVDGRARAEAPRVLRALPPATGESELQREQVETGSAPHTRLDALREDLLSRRRALAAAAADPRAGTEPGAEPGTEPGAEPGAEPGTGGAGGAAGAAGARARGALLVALGTHPLGGVPTLSPGSRYERLSERFGLLAREQLTCGCHVHVGVADRDEGAAVLDRVRPWAPVLLALSGNSPYWQGVDTGHASYRSRVWDRWPTAGPSAAVGDAAGYDALVRRVLSTGVPMDLGMIYFDVRLSARYPTVEVRVADVCLRVDDAVLLAGLVRALADTAVADHRAGRPVPEAPVEVLRLAAWRASCDGLDGDLVHPLTGSPRPAAQVVADLLEHVAPALARTGDEEAVRAGAAAVLRRGTGARWQRAAVADGGVPAMLARAARLTLDLPGDGPDDGPDDGPAGGARAGAGAGGDEGL
ncbi:carboxylate-amine ligase [Kineococcus gypseus]|uniref:carboxylate-amine ligase n=1 Tax=Kineococcus gypseus TaxID=1637102 RepID=UPI003D7F1886